VLWHVLIERINLEYEKRLRDQPDLHEQQTVIVEFSRGSSCGGYRAAYPHLSEMILRRAAIMYVDISYEESRLRNARRFNPDRPDSILQHSVPEEKMERLYRDDDFRDLAAADPHTLTIKSLRVPYVVFDNHDDVTSGRPDQLAARLQERLDILWELYRG
jgi:hypothetical protein